MAATKAQIKLKLQRPATTLTRENKPDTHTKPANKPNILMLKKPSPPKEKQQNTHMERKGNTHTVKRRVNTQENRANTKVGDMQKREKKPAPGKIVDVKLSAEGHSFEWWKAHAEAGASEH